MIISCTDVYVDKEKRNECRLHEQIIDKNYITSVCLVENKKDSNENECLKSQIFNQVFIGDILKEALPVQSDNSYVLCQNYWNLYLNKD
jgi:hypothetical protein